VISKRIWIWTVVGLLLAVGLALFGTACLEEPDCSVMKVGQLCPCSSFCGYHCKPDGETCVKDEAEPGEEAPPEPKPEPEPEPKPEEKSPPDGGPDNPPTESGEPGKEDIVEPPPEPVEEKSPVTLTGNITRKDPWPNPQPSSFKGKLQVFVFAKTCPMGTGGPAPVGQSVVIDADFTDGKAEYTYKVGLTKGGLYCVSAILDLKGDGPGTGDISTNFLSPKTITLPDQGQKSLDLELSFVIPKFP
jgi:hypothetical protein